MQQKVLKQWVIYQSLWKRLKHPLTGLVLLFGVFLTNIPSVDAQNAVVEAKSSVAAIESAAMAKGNAEDSLAEEGAVEADANFPADGIYLYGQSPQPGQIGVDYAVMEVRDRQTVGAFYRVSSSFDCFHGEVGSEQLNLTVVNSYEQASYSYALPIDQTATVASNNGSGSGAVELLGLHSIDTISDMDMEILSTCQAIHSQEI